MLNRRKFIAGASLLAGGLATARASDRLGRNLKGSRPGKIQKISEVTKPLAITMVDYSWMLKHHRYGAYEDYDRFFTELVERGYNAVRMDCFPQFIASDNDGKIEESFLHKKEDRERLLWGHDFSIRSHPRKSLVEFLRKCREYGVHAGLTTWFISHGTTRPDIFEGVDGFVRAWDETLTFIKENGLMDVVTYVDLLNEYPFAHGLTWLKKEMNKRSDTGKFKLNNPDANIPPDDLFETADWINNLQVVFYQDFMRRTIDKLKAKWPELDFFTSETGQKAPQDYSNFDAIDKHFWFVHNKELADNTGFRRMVWKKETDLDFRDTYYTGLKHWDANKERYGRWMEGRIEGLAKIGREFGVPVGNTEGWGAVFWEDNPTIDWRFIKEAAEIAVPLAAKHGYKFVCTSNFTSPQFIGIWQDIRWHQEMTGLITSA
jgi:hypothetical protein